MNIIFLDIDGVLNNKKTETFIFCNPDKYGLDEGNLSELTYIKNNIKDCGIVLITSWRKYNIDYVLYNNDYYAFESPMRKIFKYLDNNIIAICPHKKSQSKYQDIIDYINDPNLTIKIDNFVIIDDDWKQDLNKFGDKFFQTDYHYGLTKEISDKIIKYFNKGLEK